MRRFRRTITQNKVEIHRPQNERLLIADLNAVGPKAFDHKRNQSRCCRDLSLNDCGIAKLQIESSTISVA